MFDPMSWYQGAMKPDGFTQAIDRMARNIARYQRVDFSIARLQIAIHSDRREMWEARVFQAAREHQLGLLITNEYPNALGDSTIYEARLSGSKQNIEEFSTWLRDAVKADNERGEAT